MREAAIVLKETNKERNMLKNSALHKKNGPAVSKLGNKRMSWQEINSKHGPVKTYDLDSFMTYDEFKLLPPDLKVEYINGLCEKYKIRVSHVSEFLFDAGEKGLMGYMKIYGLYEKCMQGKTRDVAPESIQKFKDDISEWEKRKTIAESVDQQQRNDILGTFITYDAYFAMDPLLQRDWLNSIITKYNVTKTTITTVLFKKSENCLDYRLKKTGVFDDIIKLVGKSNEDRHSCIEAFEKAVKEWEGKNSMQTVEEAPVVTLKTEKPKKEAKEIAEDILKSIIGEREETPEEPKPVEAEPVEELKPELVEELESIAESAKPEIAQPIVSELPTLSVPNYSAVFSANYVSDTGLDEKQLFALMSLFQDRKVRVSINVEVVG